MTQEKFKELVELVVPVVDFVKENGTIHDIIIISGDRFDMYHGACGSAVGYIKEDKK